ncbi:AAA family ATPase, partial [Turicibacter sanguinis]|nr:AAA family ATPase [Turicibacter sanguinis]
AVLKNLDLDTVLYFLNYPRSRSVYSACGNRFKGVLQLEESYKVMRDLDFGDRNTVVVGANGCGKTSLATQLQQIVHKNLGIVIPAQRVLLIPNIKNIPSKTTADAIYETFDRSIPNYKKNFSIDNPTRYHSYEEAIGSEFTFLLTQLFSEKIANYFKLEDEFNANPKDPGKFASFFNSKANEVIGIWESLFPGLILKLKETGSLRVRRKTTIEYDGNSLSEGEKEALYLIGRVLLAPKNSLIIVDEPEAHLHKSVVCALWDKLEQKREDCVFFYFTHDIDFAVTRDAKKIWIKSFEYPNHWDFRFLSDDTIPEDLYLELLGSKRKVLFCEGKKQSFDYKLYSAL